MDGRHVNSAYRIQRLIRLVSASHRHDGRAMVDVKDSTVVVMLLAMSAAAAAAAAATAAAAACRSGLSDTLDYNRLCAI
jgi:mevalonate pyrophosphate decarboxylase